MPIVAKFVLTGGDCGGKTSAEKFLREELEKMGYAVIFVPEVASRVIAEYGINPSKLTRDQYLNFERLVLGTQIHEEDVAEANAEKIRGDQKIILFFDRGCMDNAAYMTREDFIAILKEFNTCRLALCEYRYDAVFHLVTAAEGAEDVYNRVLKENPARHGRSAADARDLDKRIQNAWLGHPHLRIIDNSTGFQEKLQRLIFKVKRALGDPEKIEIERKFLVSPDCPKSIPVPIEMVNIDQYYLKSKEVDRVRQWSRCDGSDIAIMCYQTKKIPTGTPGSNIEIEKIIDPAAFLALREACRDPEREQVNKNRYYFLYKNQYFSLDVFNKPERHQGLRLLEIELDDETERVEIPDWLGEAKGVTGDKNYSNKNLAKRP